MSLTLPESMDELVYWTSRKIKDGRIKAWVYREDCPECGKEKMGKPVNEKTGKIKVRAKIYECPSCGHTVDKPEYEDSLTANIIYTCPHCKHKGEAQIPFKRKTYKGVKSLVFQCESCNEKIPITKKMKAIKKK
jgi:predicted RNA-binding Zn-ribbon protein involved in translation (DUF1610 family)